jgi:hypothetical protein
MTRLFLATALTITLAFACIMGGFAYADSAADGGLRQGDSIGVFYVTKVAGADDDGVEPGEDLCYRCRYGSRPIVMIFARQTDGKVTELVKAVDAAVAENEAAGLRGLLTLMGEDAVGLKATASEIAKQGNVKHVPLAVAKDTQTGPINYKLSDDAPVTIVLAKDSQVVTTHTFAADAIDVAAVMQEVQQMLN